MTHPHTPDGDDSQQPGRRPPDYVIVTWVSEQLRDRVQRTGLSLAEALRAGRADELGPQQDPEAEP